MNIGNLIRKLIIKHLPDNYLDGNIQKNELKGLFKTNGDSYMTFSLGVNWYFETGEKSNI